jgi:Uma2 family endonuclease
MSITAVKPKRAVVYPESDGQPMAENTLQFQWIVTIVGGLQIVFQHEELVFVAGDLFWYPVEGDPTIRTAPDALVVFGRPKGHRGSYQQWEEGNIAPQVVFEVQSPGNRFGEMLRKFEFYERYGVEEYYLFDPDRGNLSGWIRQDNKLIEIADMNGWESPRLRIRFVFTDGELSIYGPDDRPFATYLEIAEQRETERREKESAQREVERLSAQLRALGKEPTI